MGALEFRTVHTADGPRLEAVMKLQQAVLDVAYTDDEGTRGYVDVAYTNACTDDALDAEVARVHALYKQGLRELYASNRESCGYGGRELVFTCEQMEEAKRQKKAQ